MRKGARKMAQSSKTPLVRISKRPDVPVQTKIIVYAAAILLALVVCGIVTTFLTGLNPVAVYTTMIGGAFGSTRRVWVMLQDLAMLLCVSLALAPAFRMKFWNLGGEGQVLMGCFACASCMLLIGDKLPSAALILVSLVASVAAGALWGLVPALF